MSFARLNFPLRTDISFRQRQQSEHHKMTSPIERLPVDMICDFPTSDPLHLLELGVMKKCLIRWKEGSKGYKRHWKEEDIVKLNEMLSASNNGIPSEIHRSVRSLHCLSDWKGSEYRTFLLYVGMVVLKDFLKQEEYQHFLKLCCAATICSSDIYRKYVIRKDNRRSLSDCLFHDYIEKYIEIFGSHSVSSNVHNLIHITDDVIKFGNLNNISTYPFENRLGMIKNKLKKCNKPLEQIARRINEIKDVMFNKNHSNLNSSTQFPKLKHPVASNQSFSTVIFKEDFRLSTKKFSDKWFLARTTEGIRIMEMTKITRSQTLNLVIFGKPLRKIENFFESPFSSSNIYIYLSDGSNDEEISLSISMIVCKMVCLGYKQEFVFIPLLHTYKV